MKTFRKIIFWTHLCLAIPAAVFIFIMAATGVLLTYEHAIINWVANSDTVEAAPGNTPLSVDEIASIAQDETPEKVQIMLSFDNREGAPVTVYQLRHGQLSLNPYTGEERESQAAAVEEWMHHIVELHRWLGMEGKSRDTARMINGAANLVFLFLVVSGLYLWFPKAMKWMFFSAHLFFMKKYPTSKARDYNWHHVFGIWALIPLFFIVISGAVFYYPWANKMVYSAFGEEAPKRQGPAFLSGGSLEDERELADPAGFVSLQAAFDTVKATDEGWTSINMMLPKEGESSVRVMLNNGAGYLPEQRTTHFYDLAEAKIVKTETYDDMSAGRKARMWMRFIHTGEQYGLLGSTIAGLASIAACFLTWTGLALAYRRLILPLFRKRKKAQA